MGSSQPGSLRVTGAAVSEHRQRIARPGPGKGWRCRNSAGNAQLFADLANFVFIERRQRLDDPARLDQLLDARHAIVMSLDDVGLRGAARFDGVRINRALSQDPMAVEKVAGAQDAFLHHDELLADDVALWSRDRTRLRAPSRIRLRLPQRETSVAPSCWNKRRT